MVQPQVHLRSPRIKIKFQTVENTFDLSYDTKAFKNTDDFKKVASGEITSALISLATQNDMANDSGTFSLTLIGTQNWEEILDANDLVKIYIDPSKPKVNNDCVMVGLITSVKRVAEYSENSKVYTIQGQSMAKALMKMDIGTIQEVSAMLSGGWMYSITDVEEGASGTSKGFALQGKSASDVVRSIIDYFLLDHAVYSFARGTKKASSLKDHITMSLSSHADEYLTDQSDFVSYTGSLRQFITKAQAKPFNEFFHDFTKDGKCSFVMRPTPFEKKEWNKLPLIQMPSIYVLEQTVEKSDEDAYSIFSCSIPSNAFGMNTTLIAQPKTAQSLIEKYGYTFMEVENRYIFQTEESAGGELSGETGQSLDSGNFGTIDSADIDVVRKGTLAYTDKNVITAEQINNFLKSKNPTSTFIGHGDYFIEAGKISGLNPIYILAHACLESAWGKSDMSHNYFGIGAFDNNPQNGHNYGNATMKDGLINGASWIAKNFFSRGQKSLYTMRHNGGQHEYATDPEWDKKIASIMAQCYKFINYDFSKSNSSGNTGEGSSRSTTPTTRDTTPTNDTPNTDDKTDKEKEKEKKDKENERDKKEEMESTAGSNKARINAYSMLLYNWYADNPSYYNGTIRYIGNPDFRVGTRLHQLDSASQTIWEYYIESVSHDFFYTTGYSTLVGVTRGLKANSDRFKHHNQAQDFTGGFFGEATLAEQYEKGRAEMETAEDGSSSGGGEYVPDDGNVYKATYDNGYVATIYAPELGDINVDPNSPKGMSASGVMVKNFETCAVDPNDIPLGSIIAVKIDGRPELTKLWFCIDTGGAIKGKRIDLCVDGNYAKTKSFKGSAGVAIMSKGSGAPSARERAKKIDSLFDKINKESLVSNSSTVPGGLNGKIVSLARKYKKPNFPSRYLLGGGHGVSTNPLKNANGKEVLIDCSGFTGWVMEEAGVTNWGKGDAVNTARGSALSSKLNTVNDYEGSGISSSRKLAILAKAVPGDLIFFNTNANPDSHIAIYDGKEGGTHYQIGSSGKALTSASGIKRDAISDAYWLKKFNGRIRRAK